MSMFLKMASSVDVVLEIAQENWRLRSLLLATASIDNCYPKGIASSSHQFRKFDRQTNRPFDRLAVRRRD